MFDAASTLNRAARPGPSASRQALRVLHSVLPVPGSPAGCSASGERLPHRRLWRRRWSGCRVLRLVRCDRRPRARQRCALRARGRGFGSVRSAGKPGVLSCGCRRCGAAPAAALRAPRGPAASSFSSGFGAAPYAAAAPRPAAEAASESARAAAPAGTRSADRRPAQR